MKRFRVRFTVRWLMVAVAVTAIGSLFWSAWLNRRAAYCRSEAEWHAHEQWRSAQNRDFQLAVAGRAKDPAVTSILNYDAGRWRQAIIWHASREREFRGALSRPWEPLPKRLRDAPWRPIPANLYPAGADPNDFWINADGSWGTKKQAMGKAPGPGQ